MSEKRSITMTDGQVVEFNAKQRLVKTSTIEGNDVCVRLDFENGETRSFTMPEDMLARFAAHGAEQKLGDCIAGEKDIDDAVLSMEDLIERLNKGEWNAVRKSGGFAGTSPLIQALLEVSDLSVEEVKAYLADKTQADKIALRRTEKLAPIIARIEAEKAKKSKSTVNTEALFDELAQFSSPPEKAKKAS